MKQEISMKVYRSLVTFATLPVILTVFITCPLAGSLTRDSYAIETNSQSKIISDTLATHKVTCLSRNGTIMTVFMDGKWVDVREVELVSSTLILRTDAGTLSLAAVMNKNK